MKKKFVAYRENEINSMVEELRDEGWDFYFYGATDEAKKEQLKTQAIDLGFRAAETLVFDFNGRQFGALLKTMLKTMVGNSDRESSKQVPICENAQKAKLVKCVEKQGPTK